MAARAIIGIAIGFLFAPVIFLLLYTNAMMPTSFSSWFWSLFHDADFTGFATTWASAGISSTFAPLWGPTATYIGNNSLISGFGAGSLLGTTGPMFPGFLPAWGPGMIVWAIVGVWAGAIERSPGRAIGVGVGCWLGWLIVAILLWFINPTISMIPFQTILGMEGITTILLLILTPILTVVVVIVVAAIFGALTKSEEF
jgi:hypothetical protein